MGQNTVRRRMGVTYVLEAILAAFVLLFFVLVMTQTGVGPADTGSDLTERTYHVLSALDTAGMIRGPALDGDLNRLEDRVQNHLPGQQIAVAQLTVNSTTAEPSFSTTHTRNISVTADTERQVLRLWYRDATAPNVSIAGTYITNHTGTVTDQQETFDISQYTSTGTNTLQIDVSGSSRIGYSADIYDRERSGTPPSTADVFTSSYIVSGANTSFQPAEVTMLAWQ